MTARSGSLKLEEAPQHAGNKPCGSMESGQVKPTLSGGALQMDTHDRNSRHLTQPLYYTGKWWARRLAGITSWMVQLAVDGTPDSVVLDPSLAAEPPLERLSVSVIAASVSKSIRMPPCSRRSPWPPRSNARRGHRHDRRERSQGDLTRSSAP